MRDHNDSCNGFIHMQHNYVNYWAMQSVVEGRYIVTASVRPSVH